MPLMMSAEIKIMTSTRICLSSFVIKISLLRRCEEVGQSANKKSRREKRDLCIS
jgi:hypothetical protein